ncbi:DUF2470 domain-containing protein [Embleya sp. NPDC050493]|uniref:DUF2470 domain-containing protein n=1 Tax=Embleya sp. NPDC050493 TaxID=3363989 RepID=UPI00379CB6FA
MSVPTEANAGRTDVSSRRPQIAERARTLAGFAGSATLELPGDREEQVVPAARAVEPDGSLLLLVPGETAAVVLTSREDVAAVLHLVDVAPVAVPHRVRAHCWIAGWLTIPTGTDADEAAARLAGQAPDPTASPRAGTIVRLEVGEVLVDDLWGTGHVEPEEYADARPDPLADHEAELLQHLAAAHGNDLCRLASLAGAPACDERVAPVSLDRHGIRLRTGGPERTCDVRFDFETPVAGPTQLGEALRRLLHGVHGGVQGQG